MTVKRDGFAIVDAVAAEIDAKAYDDRELGRKGDFGFEVDDQVTAAVRHENERRRMKARDRAAKIIRLIALFDGKSSASCPGCAGIPFANCPVCNGHGVIKAEGAPNDTQ